MGVRMTWTIAPILRPVEQHDVLAVASKLQVTRFALNEIAKAISSPSHPVTGKRWNTRERLAYMQLLADEALRQTQ
jgi:hypothetical protein